MLKVYNIVNQNFSVLYSIYSHYKIPCGAVRAGATKGHCCPTWTHTLQAPGHLCIPRYSIFQVLSTLDPVPSFDVE